jgi:hypothetical protein
MTTRTDGGVRTEVRSLSTERGVAVGFRVTEHPILADQDSGPAAWTTIMIDGKEAPARLGEPIAAALLASGRRVLRHTPKLGEPRGVYCAIGLCTDCIMTVNGQPNVRTCVTLVEPGMRVETQIGHGSRE